MSGTSPRSTKHNTWQSRESVSINTIGKLQKSVLSHDRVKLSPSFLDSKFLFGDYHIKTKLIEPYDPNFQEIYGKSYCREMSPLKKLSPNSNNQSPKIRQENIKSELSKPTKNSTWAVLFSEKRDLSLKHSKLIKHNPIIIPSAPQSDKFSESEVFSGIVGQG